jgi:hypothetical protein
MASDTSDGSTSVKISGQEVMLKNKSCFKKSMGDEAGSAPKKGVVTSKNMGKVYFTMWSMDVKIEGENVVRMLDLTTHNHMGKHHTDAGQHAALAVHRNRQMSGVKPDYTRSTAPCICAQGLNQHTGIHGEYHKIVDLAEFKSFEAGNDYKYQQARDNAVGSVSKVNNLHPPEKEKVEGCIKLQLDNYYKDRCGMKESDAVNSSGARGKNLQGASSTVPTTGA